MSPNRRPKLPLPIRRKIQAVVRNMAFFGIAWLTLWQLYVTVNEFGNAKNVLKLFGFVPGIV